MESLGFSYKSISDTNPGLIMTSVTPYGQTGPHSEFDYTELTVFAMSGAMHREGLPNRYPIRYGAEVAQYYSGNLAAAATVSALLKFLRKDKKFMNSSQLIRQMNKDVIFAKKGLKTKLIL